jgi:hypothetical protein
MLFTKNIFQLIKINLRWKKAKKRGDGLLLKIGDLNNFFASLNSHGVEYVVLRGLTKATPSDDESGDIDMLTTSSDIKKIIIIGSNYPGTIPVDIYFNDRPSVKKYHYYPPVLAEKILNNKTLCTEKKYFVPQKKYLLLSLLYHVTYHKGILSTYNEVDGDFCIKNSPHYATLCDLIKELNFSLTLNLLKIDLFLKQQKFAMPFDLLMKWPNHHNLLKIIFKNRSFILNSNDKNISKFPLIFIVRSDASDPKLLSLLLKLIEETMKVRSCLKLSQLQIENISVHTRGGNWVERKKGRYEQILPTHMIITDFLNLNELNNFCIEQLSELKKCIREALSEHAKSQVFGLHSADNYLESLEYLEVLNYGAEPT